MFPSFLTCFYWRCYPVCSCHTSDPNYTLDIACPVARPYLPYCTDRQNGKYCHYGRHCYIAMPCSRVRQLFVSYFAFDTKENVEKICTLSGQMHLLHACISWTHLFRRKICLHSFKGNSFLKNHITYLRAIEVLNLIGHRNSLGNLCD